MEAVTGQVELRTKSKDEVEQFVRQHLEVLRDAEITIRQSESGDYVLQFYDTNEPNL